MKQILYWADIALGSETFSPFWITYSYSKEYGYIATVGMNEQLFYTLPIVKEEFRNNVLEVNFIKPPYEGWQIKGKGFSATMGYDSKSPDHLFGQGWVVASQVRKNHNPQPCSYCGWYCFQQCLKNSLTRPWDRFGIAN